MLRSFSILLMLLGIGGTLSAESQLYPEDSGILDVTKPPYNAAGDGVTDDTAALRQAIFDAIGLNKSTQTVFLPHGTYLVSDSLGGYDQGGNVQTNIRILGESRDGTIVRLKDNIWTNRLIRKPVFRFSTNGGPGGNDAFDNYLHRLTISVGNGNPGAIGVDYIASNRGSVRDVRIQSEDGAGSIGLLLTQFQQGPHLIKRVEIVGFDRGIDSNGDGINISFADITLRDQNVEGWRNNGLAIGIRSLVSENAVPTFINTGTGMVALDTVTIAGHTSASPAIQNTADIYLRDASYSGTGLHFRSANEDGGTDELGDAFIADYASSGPKGLFTDLPAHLRLPREDWPDYHTNDFSDWANVLDYGADYVGREDDLAAIQAAIDSGKSIVYFPSPPGTSGEYTISDTLYIRGNVRKIIGMGNRLRFRGEKYAQDGQFGAIVLENNAVDTVIIDGLTFDSGEDFFHYGLHYNSSVDLVIRDGGGAIYNSPGAGTLYLEDVVLGYLHLVHPQRVIADQLNVEPFNGTKIWNNGGDLYTNGYKSERNTQALMTTNGGRSQVMGAYHLGQWEGTDNSPIYRTIDSALTTTFTAKQQQGFSYEMAAIETQGGETRFGDSDFVRSNTLRTSSHALYTAGTSLDKPDGTRVYVLANFLKGSFPTASAWEGFTVYRSDNAGSLTVPLGFTADAALAGITAGLPQSVSFADGQYAVAVMMPAFDASTFSADQYLKVEVAGGEGYTVGYPAGAWVAFLDSPELDFGISQTNPVSWFDPAHGVTFSEDGLAHRWFDMVNPNRRFYSLGSRAPNPRMPAWEAAIFGSKPVFRFDGSLWQIERDSVLSGEAYSERTFAIQFMTGLDVGKRQVLWSTGDATNSMSVYISAGKLYVLMEGVDVRRWGPIWVETPVQAQTAYLLTTTSSKTGGELIVYLNGTEAGRTTGVNKVGSQFFDTNMGGQRQFLQYHDGESVIQGHQNLFYGHIGAVAVWNRILDETERALVNARLSASGEQRFWYGYPVDANGFVDTGVPGWFNGPLFVDNDPWIWSAALARYLYLPDDSGWGYIPRPQ